MYLDILIGIILFFSVVFGISNGFFTEFLSIFGVIADFWLTQKLTPIVLEKIGIDMGSIGYLTVYSVVFTILYMILGMFIYLINNLFKAQKKGVITRFLGAVVGFLKGALLCILIIFVYDIASEKFESLKKYGENAYAKRVFLEVTPYIEEYIPEQVKNQLNEIKNNEIVNKYIGKIL